jgi:4-amino-4-deoxy-L-arabinose transferase-like glycosyltransferase
MMSLLRLYVAEATTPTRGLALAFWAAMGVGMLVNALQTPVLVVVTLIALFCLDRDLGWLRRTHPLMGLPVALLIAAPWLAVRALQDGMPYAGLGTRDVLDALGGAQDMRLRAWTGTFALAAIVGFLPGTALLPDALKRIWDERGSRLARFLLAWIAGYLVYLELFSAKPATYSVQLIYPALALAVARIVMAQAEGREPPRWSLVPRPFFGALLPVGLFAALYVLLREPPTLLAVLFITVVTGLSAYAGHVRDLRQWAGLAAATFALFAVTLIAVVAPSLHTIWPARAIAHANRQCPGDVMIFGFPEPSAAFTLGERWKPIAFELTPEVRSRLHVVESRWLDSYRGAMAERRATPVELGCIEALNPMRGCPMTFTFMTIDRAASKCAGQLGVACERVKKQKRPPLPDCG